MKTVLINAGSRSSGPKTARVFVFLESRSRCVDAAEEPSPPPRRGRGGLSSARPPKAKTAEAVARALLLRAETSGRVQHSFGPLGFGASPPSSLHPFPDGTPPAAASENPGVVVSPPPPPPASLELRPIVVVTESSALTPRCPDETYIAICMPVSFQRHRPGSPVPDDSAEEEATTPERKEGPHQLTVADATMTLLPFTCPFRAAHQGSKSHVPSRPLLLLLMARKQIFGFQAADRGAHLRDTPADERGRTSED
ncbi:hypothetical protein MRX96_043052 [Rhipicephalus microplus]